LCTAYHKCDEFSGISEKVKCKNIKQVDHLQIKNIVLCCSNCRSFLSGSRNLRTRKSTGRQREPEITPAIEPRYSEYAESCLGKENQAKMPRMHEKIQINGKLNALGALDFEG
jgi:hypothetical protein